MTSRVLVHLRRSASENPIAAGFTESIVSALTPKDVGSPTEEDEIPVLCRLDEDKFVLERTARSDRRSSWLRRPPQCPIKLLTPEDASLLPEEAATRGVGVGVVALVESCDGHVLLTRRPKHMRTFPGVWVPPGGSLDRGETMLDCGLRELREEVGLAVGREHACAAKVLCLWESVYPPFLERGLPRRHHVVVYYHILLDEDHRSLDDRLVFQPEEVDASAWVSGEDARLVVEGTDGNGGSQDRSFRVKEMDASGKIVNIDCPSSVLMSKAPTKGVDVERVSSGTLYALSQWLKLSSGPK